MTLSKLSPSYYMRLWSRNFPTPKQNLTVARNVIQGWQHWLQAYYKCIHWAYFGSRYEDEKDAKDAKQQLQDLKIKAHNKQRAASKKALYLSLENRPTEAQPRACDNIWKSTCPYSSYSGSAHNQIQTISDQLQRQWHPNKGPTNSEESWRQVVKPVPKFRRFPQFPAIHITIPRFKISSGTMCKTKAQQIHNIGVQTIYCVCTKHSDP